MKGRREKSRRRKVEKRKMTGAEEKREKKVWS